MVDYMGYEINWHTNAGDKVLLSPFYQQYSRQTFADLVPQAAAIKADILAAKASNESADVINYLMWLTRVLVAVA